MTSSHKQVLFLEYHYDAVKQNSVPIIVLICLNINHIKVPQGCEVLPDSPNPGFEKGCRGAVNLKGNPSRQYCTNDDKPEYRFRWFEKCCKYENNDCVPRTVQKGIKKLIT